MSAKEFLMLCKDDRLTYREEEEAFIFLRPVGVEEFIRFKEKLKQSKVEYKNIIVIDWYL